MIGKIFITRHGYDPQLGRHVKDPFLGDIPSIGACRPDFRKKLAEGDHLFVISGKVKGANQYVMGGFEVAEKINMLEAYSKYPEQRLCERFDGQLTGNIIVDEASMQHELDDHTNFENRVSNYIIGRNRIVLETGSEIARGRDETLNALREIMKKDGDSPIEVVGRWGSQIDENQISDLRSWLASLKGTRHVSEVT